ncbi:MAG: type IV toxin-antitoxin system AbiEi family antitoxin domain-containing protein [Deltaproteobacteria bacterium]|nr:type IV toxin-antitoxin system AbiEi family antitoxin domain-containing protein [Deltaproteobacteria bacterium]
MTKKRTKAEEVLELARKLGVLRVREAMTQGIHPEHLRRLCQQGKLERVGRGLYRLPDADVTEHATLATVAKRFPNGVICLLSALRFHGIGTQNPREIWMALRRGTAIPRNSDLPVRFMVFSEASFKTGVEKHVLENVRVRVTTPAKTIADCFKYRNKVGLDVALEALRESLRQRKCTADDIWRYAKVCRTTNVMRPYLEATL